VEPPVEDSGLGNGGGSHEIAAAWFYRLAAECASRAFLSAAKAQLIQSKMRPCPGAAPTWPHCCPHNGACAMIGKMKDG
jgi:hypothetical protein